MGPIQHMGQTIAGYYIVAPESKQAEKQTCSPRFFFFSYFASVRVRAASVWWACETSIGGMFPELKEEWATEVVYP